jgi:hypothetical protein
MGGECMIFKPGDKVYSYRHGIVTLVEVEDALTSEFSIGIQTEIGIEGHTAEGRCLTIDKFPSIITLEFAEKRGLVQKRNVRHERRHAYIDERDNSFHITTNSYGRWADQWDDYDYPEPDYLKFMYYVDDQGNRCEWPEPAFEWVETLRVQR